MHQPNTPVALTIAGSDSGGEAGIQADLNTFACLKVHGADGDHVPDSPKSGENFAIGTVPAHHGPRAIGSHRGAFHRWPRRKRACCFRRPSFAKSRFFSNATPEIPLVVDPVMVSTSGRRLLQSDGIKALEKQLLPLATIVTPNLAEAEILAGGKIRSLVQLRARGRDDLSELRLRRAGQGRPFDREPAEPWIFSMAGKENGCCQRPGPANVSPARHRLHLFGGHHRLAGAGKIAHKIGRTGQGLHHPRHP